ncbi:2386_t:CDS:2 [Funneliformis caledonium]|uniref:2386_t:CDS:1 n=2 Tax=Funneliformis TaxID=1117308 RepID=A0A9N8YP15_9GLOM|nr:2386_t:CDS:2 [Funneliformis caledonium]CAG8516932.1 11098_t:CDS:2 [Funneliformis mosseae]
MAYPSYPPGKIILLDEIENNTKNWFGEYLRIAGKLIYHNTTKNIAVIEQNIKYTSNKEKQREGHLHEKFKIKNCFLIVDTKLVEDEPYKECKIAEFLGLLINDNDSVSKFYQLPQKIQDIINADIQRTNYPLLEARIFRNVDFMDMDLYQDVINMRNKYEQ